MDFLEMLKYISVPNRDNGKQFVDDRRLERIGNLLWDSKYRKVNSDGLYVLYASKPLNEIAMPILISSHVDCVPEIKNCFVEEANATMFRGTFDNAITNAAILNLMVNNRLPDNALIAFTGDEENDSKGAKQLSRFLSRKGIIAPVIVLDVTEMGWRANADFTIENNYWKSRLGKVVVNAAQMLDWKWAFVPSDLDNIPSYVDEEHIISVEAAADESEEYQDQGMECFSFCLPVRGEMHSDNGVLARKSSCIRYVEALCSMIHAISESLS